ncbi:MAG: Rpn family recombination-promoting nuclease/putative transposase [Lachnospiraceae bacterium]|uniref:Rpn family recombination-promoting nuclease/putative transposase n=1 Tax=Massilistercora timonensis TaxID=2086584 RepID=UPI00320A31C5
MQKRNLEELNLLDDFLMGSVLSYPGIGPEVCRRMVSIILNREIKQIRIIPQKVYFGADTDKHGIRLDVYAEEKADDLNTVYDIEPDKDGRESLRLALPKRARFYHAKIDADSLASGEDYGKLKNVIVIFICPYDPFQLNRMVYTIKSCCVEEPDLVYEDGARTMFLYTKGTKGNPPAELQRLLQYLEDSREENAKDADLMAIHQMVQKVKHDREVSLEYMKIFERERLIREDGYASGKEAELVEIIRRKQQKGLSADDIAEWLELDKEYVEKVMKLKELS